MALGGHCHSSSRTSASGRRAHAGAHGGGNAERTPAGLLQAPDAGPGVGAPQGAPSLLLPSLTWEMGVRGAPRSEDHGEE